MPGAKGRSGGHNRKLNAEKIKLGVKKDRINLLAPETIKGEVVEFAELSELGKQIRDWYKPILINSGALSVTDSMIFFMFCDTAAHYIEVRDHRLKKGDWVPTKDKEGTITGVARAPWSILEEELKTRLQSIGTELGLSPRTRDSIIKISEKKPINPFALK